MPVTGTRAYGWIMLNSMLANYFPSNTTPHKYHMPECHVPKMHFSEHGKRFASIFAENQQQWGHSLRRAHISPPYLYTLWQYVTINEQMEHVLVQNAPHCIDLQLGRLCRCTQRNGWSTDINDVPWKKEMARSKQLIRNDICIPTWCDTLIRHNSMQIACN